MEQVTLIIKIERIKEGIPKPLEKIGESLMGFLKLPITRLVNKNRFLYKATFKEINDEKRQVFQITETGKKAYIKKEAELLKAFIIRAVEFHIKENRVIKRLLIKYWTKIKGVTLDKLHDVLDFLNIFIEYEIIEAD